MSICNCLAASTSRPTHSPGRRGQPPSQHNIQKTTEAQNFSKPTAPRNYTACKLDGFWKWKTVLGGLDRLLDCVLLCFLSSKHFVRTLGFLLAGATAPHANVCLRRCLDRAPLSSTLHEITLATPTFLYSCNVPIPVRRSIFGCRCVRLEKKTM